MTTTTNTAAHELTRQAIVAGLVESGWTARNSTAIASKSFDTAVGQKEALVFLESWGDSPNFVVGGQYYSEGRNALSSTSVFIRKDASEAEAQRLASVFAAQADAAVGETYAMRLARGETAAA